MFENGDELERMGKENIVACFMVMAQTCYRGTEWHYKNLRLDGLIPLILLQPFESEGTVWHLVVLYVAVPVCRL
jgi:hypothetical protein